MPITVRIIAKVSLLADFKKFVILQHFFLKVIVLNLCCIFRVEINFIGNYRRVGMTYKRERFFI